MSGSAGMDLLQKRTYIHATTTDYSAAPSEVVTPPFANPIDVYRFGYIAETAVVIDANGTNISLEAEIAGGGTNRVSGAALVQVDADDHAQGRVIYTDVIAPVAQATGVDGSKVNVGPAGPFHVKPGERVSFNITNQATSGTIRFFMEYVEFGIPQPSTVANSDGLQVTKK